MSRPRVHGRNALPAALLLILAWPGFALAADPVLSSGNLSLAGRAVGSLAGVIGLIVLLAVLLRRFRESSRLGGGASGLHSVGRLDLGSRRELRLVRIGERTLVLGVTEQRIELLAECDGPALDARSTAGEEPSRRTPALRILQQLTSSS